MRLLPCALTLLLLAAAPPRNAAAQLNLAPGVVSAVVPGHLLVVYRQGIVPADAAARAERAGAHLVGRHERFGLTVVQAYASAAEARARLAADPAVSAVLADRLVSGAAFHVQAVPAGGGAAPDSLYNSPQGWAVRLAGGAGDATAPGPWTYTRGAGIRIAVLDSGVDATHPDLKSNLALNLSVVDRTPATGLPSVCDDGSPQDQTGHGTWAASLAAGALGADTGLVAGVAPEAVLLNIKVLERLPGTPTAADPNGCLGGQAGGLLSWVIEGIDDAVSQRADIVSMSLGSVVDLTTGDGAGLKALFDQVTYAASQAGVILIASAGNDGLDLGSAANAGRYIELPAQARNVLAVVAATNPACAENLAPGAACAAGPVTLPYYSNFGAPLDALAAPGGSYPQGDGLGDPGQPSGWVTGACSAGGPYGCFGLGAQAYVQAIGTSAAAPLAAGAAALVRAAFPTWSATQVINSLRAAAVPYPGLPVAMLTAATVVRPAPLTTYPATRAPVLFNPVAH